MKKHILIIGSGIGGLSAACIMAAKGHHVTIFEKGEKPGGCCQTTHINDLTLNWGAEYITAPGLLQDVFDLAGSNFEEMVELIPLEVNTRFFDKDQRYFNLTGNKEDIIEQIRNFNLNDVNNFLELDKKYHALLQKDFVKISHEPFSSLNDKLAIAPELIRLRTLPDIYKFTAGHIEDEFLQKIFSYHPIQVGSDPRSTNYFHLLNPFLFEDQKYYYPIGGMKSIIKSLITLLDTFKVKQVYRAEVSEVLIKNHKVQGLRLIDGSIFPGDTIISNMDIIHTVNHLLPQRYKRRIFNTNFKPSDFTSSLFELILVTSTNHIDNDLIQHNVIIDNDLVKFSMDIFHKNVLSTEYIFSIHIPTRTDHTLTPEDHEIIKIVAPVPNLSTKLDWKNAGWKYRNRLLDYLEDNFFPSIRSKIIYEDHIDPHYYQDTLKYHLGAAYSLQPTLDQTFVKRPNNPVDIINGLYFVGNGTHPGAGISGVLSSAIIATELISVS